MYFVLPPDTGIVAGPWLDVLPALFSNPGRVRHITPNESLHFQMSWGQRDVHVETNKGQCGIWREWDERIRRQERRMRRES